MMTLDDIRTVALGLPGAYEHPSFGRRPSGRTKARMFAWLRDDPVALVVWVESVAERDGLVVKRPNTFFTTAHYNDQPIVLVDIDAIDPLEAAEFITESFRLRAEPALTAQLDSDTDD